MDQFLYRGVNPDMHRKNGGRLVPKGLGKPFKSHAYFNDAYWGDGSVYGDSEANTVIQHQRDSSRHETSGVSTTPIFENACRYATHDGKYATGYVYKIDRLLLEMNEVSSYEVADYAVQPTIPGDKEIILVSNEFGVLPQGIVVDVINVSWPCEP